MAQEIQIGSYYDSIRNTNKFIDIDIACKMGVEFFLSSLLFKGDLGRVVYAKEDIAFRRRVETLGNRDVHSGKSFSYLNLDLPYAAYSQTGSYEEDDRGATQNASQIVVGHWDPITGVLIKAAAVKIKYSATIFVSRLEDASIVARLLYFEKTPQVPFYFIAESDICGSPLNIPVFVTLESIDQNPDYNERDFLTKAKIFPVKVDMTVRSYMPIIEDFDGYIKLPLRFSGLYGYNDEKVVFTQKTSLIWADAKWSAHKHLVKPNTNGIIGIIKNPQKPIETIADGEMLYQDTNGIETILLNEGKPRREKVDNAIKDVVEGYFNETRDCTLIEFRQNEEKTTENEICIEWKLNPADEQNFKEILLYIPNVANKRIKKATTTSYTFKDLHPGSEYKCNIVVHSAFGTKVTYNLDLKTKGSAVLSDKLSDLLVGKTFTQI